MADFIQKVRGAASAVGYWGRNPRCRLEQEQTPEKIKALLEEKLRLMGRRARLWLPVSSATPPTTVVTAACTCTKQTRPGADYRCLTCHGTFLAPGYVRFMHETVYAASAQYATFTLVNVERDLSIKPNRLRLTSTALTGTIETPDQPTTNAPGTDWEFQAAVFRKTVSDTTVVEFSTNSGATWADITLINGATKPAVGTIRFRITLTRAALTTDSPDFEIVRITRPQSERLNQVIPTLQPGEILILRTWVVAQTWRQQNQGRGSEFQNDHSWTADLAFFDKTLVPNTRQGLVTDEEAGPHPFIEHRTGLTAGVRLAIDQISHNDDFLDVFTQQTFIERKCQPGELYHLVQ